MEDLDRYLSTELMDKHGGAIIQQMNKEQVMFVGDSLRKIGKAKGLKLLFRASEHEFSAAKFHEKCDNKPHTLTLMRNEFGKTIGGYTPVCWNAVRSGYAPDPSLASFLLSVDLGEVFRLKDANKAIYCHTGYGPIFGGGHDMYISDGCNGNNNSGCNFPYSYDGNGKYEKNQQAWTALTGSTNSNYFKVLEYEVYQVIL